MTAETAPSAAGKTRNPRKARPDAANPVLDSLASDMTALFDDLTRSLLLTTDLGRSGPKRGPEIPLTREERRVLLDLKRRGGDTESVSNGRHAYADETFSALHDLIDRGYLCLGVAPALGVCRATFVLTREGVAAADALASAS